MLSTVRGGARMPARASQPHPGIAALPCWRNSINGRYWEASSHPARLRTGTSGAARPPEVGVGLLRATTPSSDAQNGRTSGLFRWRTIADFAISDCAAWLQMASSVPERGTGTVCATLFSPNCWSRPDYGSRKHPRFSPRKSTPCNRPILPIIRYGSNCRRGLPKGTGGAPSSCRQGFSRGSVPT
jgi:hypothetical protein